MPTGIPKAKTQQASSAEQNVKIAEIVSQLGRAIAPGPATIIVSPTKIESSGNGWYNMITPFFVVGEPKETKVRRYGPVPGFKKRKEDEAQRLKMASVRAKNAAKARAAKAAKRLAALNPKKYKSARLIKKSQAATTA